MPGAGRHLTVEHRRLEAAAIRILRTTLGDDGDPSIHAVVPDAERRCHEPSTTEQAHRVVVGDKLQRGRAVGEQEPERLVALRVREIDVREHRRPSVPRGLVLPRHRGHRVGHEAPLQSPELPRRPRQLLHVRVEQPDRRRRAPASQVEHDDTFGRGNADGHRVAIQGPGVVGGDRAGRPPHDRPRVDAAGPLERLERGSFGSGRCGLAEGFDHQVAVEPPDAARPV